MSTPTLSQHSSQATASMSRQSTLVANPGSSANLTPATACTPGMTPGTPPKPTPFMSAVFKDVTAKHGATTGNNAGASVPAAASSSTPNASASGFPPVPKSSSFIRSAIKRWKSRLSPKNLQGFPNSTYEDLLQEMKRIQSEQEKSKEMMNMFRLQAFLQSMNEFGKVVEVFLNCSDMLAFIWGPVKFLLQTASTFTESFDIILDAYEQIGERMPLLLRYEELFHGDDQLLGALELIYVDILSFHEHAVRLFEQKGWRRLFRSMWKDFDIKFNGILKKLDRHKDFVKDSAEVAQYQRYRADTIAMKDANSARFRTYTQDIGDMNAKLNQLIKEAHDKKWKAVREWLATSDQAQEDHAQFRKVQAEYSTTSHWIVRNGDIEYWMDTSIPSTPVIWLNGIPGAGKTILASTIIGECKSRDDFKTVFHYCRYDDQLGNTALGIFKSLVDQFLIHCPQLLPMCHTRFAKSGVPVLNSLMVARKLLEEFCDEVPKIYIVIDGLDECEQVERKQALEILMSIATECDKNEPGKLRMLIVSQEWADIRRVLHSSSSSRLTPRTVQLTVKNNLNDISSFVRTWVERIAEKHAPLSHDLKEYLRNLTVCNAKGMFLYAKLVMENLHAAPTRDDLVDGIQEHFPNGIEEAYKRTLERIKTTSHPEEWKKAKKLLGWMICAKRRLTWQEIQVALSIDVDDQRLKYDDRRLRKHIHDICGSLVSLEGNRVSLVHSTAKTYITRVTADIYEPTIECELAVLCLRYLTFPCFDIGEVADEQQLIKDSMKDERLRRSVLEGHLAFQDYAVAKWFYHINAFVDRADDFMERQRENGVDIEMGEISVALEDFTEMYSNENWENTVVQACTTSCSPFQGLALYDHLISLTSHIYTFQNKGFEARHKVSIKNLSLALTRNRKLLEDLPAKFTKAELAEFKTFYDNERPYKCTKITCRYFSEGFRDAKARKRHVNMHERPFHCDVPDCLGAEGFANQNDLQKHTRAFHPEMSDLAEVFKTAIKPTAKTDHTCTICGKSFTRNFARRNHELSHRGVRPHECPECGKAFTRANDLKRHQRLHERA